jgi:hypothetical protein
MVSAIWRKRTGAAGNSAGALAQGQSQLSRTGDRQSKKAASSRPTVAANGRFATTASGAIPTWAKRPDSNTVGRVIYRPSNFLFPSFNFLNSAALISDKKLPYVKIRRVL